jgi:hypothetical protein
MRFVLVASLSLSSLSLSSGKKKRNKAKKEPQPTTGPYIRTGKLYFNAQKEIPFFKGETVEDPQYFLVGAHDVKEILFVNMDEDIKGKGPGTYGGATSAGRHYIDNDIDASSKIVLGRRVTYAEMMHSIATSPKSPIAPVTEDDFEDDKEVGKA